MRSADAGEDLQVRAEVSRIARRLSFVESRVTNVDGLLVSKATSTFSLRRRDEA